MSEIELLVREPKIVSEFEVFFDKCSVDIWIFHSIHEIQNFNIWMSTMLETIFPVLLISMIELCKVFFSSILVAIHYNTVNFHQCDMSHPLPTLPAMGEFCKLVLRFCCLWTFVISYVLYIPHTREIILYSPSRLESFKFYKNIESHFVSHSITFCSQFQILPFPIVIFVFWTTPVGARRGMWTSCNARKWIQSYNMQSLHSSSLNDLHDSPTILVYFLCPPLFA